jgi:hypothetical protein
MRIATSAPVKVQVKLDLSPVDLKLNRLATELSWSCQIWVILVGKRLDRYLTRVEAGGDNAQVDEWRTTHTHLFT